ncbi:MAG: polyprenyl synthetase family protein [Flavobacteriales bacterium]|nr:polyprenyl synthetase family protein [Flavobacteriales bacterium]MCB9449720.1 polyprenyl synthetase family protein [Flavobacteriales bacterium]
MPTLEAIKKPISLEIDEFEDRFRESIKSKVPLLDKITHYIVKRKGKQMRPMFVFLSGKMCGEVNDTTYRAAALIELLHTATLVHDDVVDDANLRRGLFSVNALWKNKVAVLVGDYLLSKGLLLSIDHGDFSLLRVVSDAVKDMSEGELLQIEKARKLDIEEGIYYEIIRKKTASLISSACACGAVSAGADEDTVARVHRFGELAGMAFQIKDDLFDYNLNGGSIGKPTGIDIKEKKMTLPLIHSLSKATPAEKRHIINTVKNHNTNRKKVMEVIDFVNRSGGIDYAKEKMEAYNTEALEVLHTFPESDARDGLETLVQYSMERKK